MTDIPTAARPSPLPALSKSLALTDPKTGFQTQITQQTLERWRNYILGAGRIVPCSASMASNVIALEPNDASPSIEGYIFGDCYPFWAPASSTGAVTAYVRVPALRGLPATSLATKKVYLGDSATQAGSGSLVSGQFYLPFYLPTADSNSGGFVLLGAPTSTQISGVGSFTMAAAASKVVLDIRVTASSKVLLQPTNGSAGVLQGGANGLHVSAKSAGVSFTASTSSGGGAVGTETYDYVIVG